MEQHYDDNLDDNNAQQGDVVEHEDQQQEDAQEEAQDEQADQSEGLEQEEYEQEPKEKPKKRSHIGARLSQVQREKYQALEEARALREENERLRRLADVSTQTALDHYDQSVLQKVNIAKEQKAKALESGDIHAQIDADIALSSAVAEYQNLVNIKASQRGRQQEYAPQQPYQEYPGYQQQQYAQQPYNYAQEWASQNTWCVPSSEDYDEEMASAVQRYCDEFDLNLYKAGKEAHRLSPEYFQIVDNYVNSLRESRTRTKGGDIRMRQSRGNVTPVRNSYGNPGQSRQGGGNDRIGLSDIERDIAKKFKIDEKSYLQYKIKDIQSGNRQGRY